MTRFEGSMILKCFMFVIAIFAICSLTGKEIHRGTYYVSIKDYKSNAECTYYEHYKLSDTYSVTLKDGNVIEVNGENIIITK